MVESSTTGFASDIIVVQQPDGNLWCPPVNVRFPIQQNDVSTTFWNAPNVAVSINDTKVQNFSLRELNESEFRFSSPCLKSMRLRPDLNDITFKIRGMGLEVKARLFLWHSDSRIVITDVDGTITKSDKRGILASIFGYKWKRNGVCHLFSAIERNGYKLIYLTGRPINLGEATRNLLDSMVEEDVALPKGPVIVSHEGWTAACNREVLERAPYKDFKIRMLKQILDLFPPLQSPFYAGFGNRKNDERTYLTLKIPYRRIFHLSKKGIKVKCGKKTVASFPDDYKSFHSFVDEFFPQGKDSATTVHSPSFARRVKEYFKSLIKPYHCCENHARSDS